MQKFASTKNKSTHKVIFGKLISLKELQNYRSDPAGNYMFKVNNGNTRTSCEKCSKLAIKTPERRQ